MKPCYTFETIMDDKLLIHEMESGSLANFMAAFDGPQITVMGEKVMTIRPNSPRVCRHFCLLLYWYLNLNLASMSQFQRGIWDLLSNCAVLLRDMVDLRIRLPITVQGANAIVNNIIYLDTLADCHHSRDSTLAHRWATTMTKMYYSLDRAEDAEEELGVLVPSIATAIGHVRHQECCPDLSS